MKNFIQRGDVLTLIAPADVVSGDVVIVGGLVGIAANNAASGDNVECSVGGVFEMPKTVGQAIDAGAKAYWDTTTKKVSTTASGNRLIGAAVTAALAAATTVRVRLDGMAR